MKSKPRPIPGDFADFARGKTLRQIRKEYSIGWETVRSWLHEVGLGSQLRPDRPHLKRPMPEGFPELATHRSDSWLRRHFKAGFETIPRWREECGVPACVYERPSTKRTVPDGFRELAPTKYIAQLTTIYSVNPEIIRRWLRETGVRSRPAKFVSRPPVPATPGGDATLAGRAAHHLRRYYASVYRAEILPAKERRSLPNRGQGYFVVSGKGALPASEVIALAQKRGFDAEAWARI